LSSRLPGDALGAPGDVIEQAAVRGLQTEQIIAPVARGTEHGALARPRECVRGLDQERRRQRRAVGIEHDGRTMAAGEDFLNGAEQTIAEIRQRGVDQADRRRQNAVKKSLGARRRVGGVADDRRMTCRQQQIVGDIAQECGVERGGFLEGQRRHQSRLGASGRRSFGHDRDAARARRRDNFVTSSRAGGAFGRYGFAVATPCTVHHAMRPPS